MHMYVECTCSTVTVHVRTVMSRAIELAQLGVMLSCFHLSTNQRAVIFNFGALL